MKTVVLATGHSEFNKILEQNLKNEIEVVGTAPWKEAVIEVVNRTKPEILIISELLQGPTPMRELIVDLRTHYSKTTRIIYIQKNDNPKTTSFLYNFHVFDILPSQFKDSDLLKAIQQPKTFEDIASTWTKIRPMITDGEDEDDEDEEVGIDPNRYNGITSPNADSDAFSHQIISFWSVLDQSGSTSSLINTALMMSENKNLNILILDFNLDNPNIHLQLGIKQPADFSLGAILADIAEKELTINEKTLEEYIYEHPKNPNVKILSGAILKMPTPDSELAFSVFKQIIDAASNLGFNTILVDLSAGFKHAITPLILKMSHKIFLHVAQDPSSLYAAHRFFDMEVGPFVAQQIDRKRLVPVITKSQPDKRVSSKAMLDRILTVPTSAYIEYHPDFLSCLYTAVPIIYKNKDQSIYNTFVALANLAQKGTFKSGGKQKLNSGAKKKTLSSSSPSSSVGAKLQNLFKIRKK